LIPFLILNILTIPYLNNPFMKRPSRFFIVSMGVFFILYSMELLDYSWWVLLLIGFGVGLLFAILEMVGVSKFGCEIVYEIISVFASIGWIGTIADLIIDNISFLAFYFSINKVILTAILLSVGNSVGDFFGNAALAK
jgi:Ca2+/Na+ antiporter